MTKMPPVPPAQKSPKGTGSNPAVSQSDSLSARENLKQQDRQANIKQNTRNQGYQQDR
jgi:hypothetical protein